MHCPSCSQGMPNSTPAHQGAGIRAVGPGQAGHVNHERGCRRQQSCPCCAGTSSCFGGKPQPRRGTAGAPAQSQPWQSLHPWGASDGCWQLQRKHSTRRVWALTLTWQVHHSFLINVLPRRHCSRQHSAAVVQLLDRPEEAAAALSGPLGCGNHSLGAPGCTVLKCGTRWQTWLWEANQTTLNRLRTRCRGNLRARYKP